MYSSIEIVPSPVASAFSNSSHSAEKFTSHQLYLGKFLYNQCTLQHGYLLSLKWQKIWKSFISCSVKSKRVCRPHFWEFLVHGALVWCTVVHQQCGTLVLVHWCGTLVLVHPPVFFHGFPSPTELALTWLHPHSLFLPRPKNGEKSKKNLLLCSLLLLMFLAMTETILTWAGSASTQFSKVRRCLRHLQHERGQACLRWEQQGRVDWLRPWWAWRESQASTGKAASPLPLTNPYLQSQTLWHKILAKPYYGLCIIYMRPQVLHVLYNFHAYA